MAVTYIKRIEGSTNNIVILYTSDSLATSTAANYITVQTPNITALNEGAWTWEPNDAILLSASDGVAWCSINAAFTTLTEFTSSPAAGVTFSGSLVNGDLPEFNGTSGVINDSGIAATNVVTKNSVNQMAAAGAILTDKAVGTATGNVVTINKQSGVVTSIALTTASGANATPIVITNSEVTTSSVVVCQIQGGTNTTDGVTILAVPGNGTITVTLTNGNVAAAALNGTVVFSFVVF